VNGTQESHLIRIAAAVDLLLTWLAEPGADHLADEALLADLQDLRDRVEEDLRTASGSG
jgi:hypothetical protein